MSVSRKPDPGQAQGLVDFIRTEMQRREISLRAAARGIGISHSHLSDILSGKKTPDAGVCGEIASFFNRPPVEIYRLAGWLGAQSDGASNVFVERRSDGSLAVYARRTRSENTLLVNVTVETCSPCDENEIEAVRNLCSEFVAEELHRMCI